MSVVLSYKILPGRGLGRLRFGASRQAVEQLLGTPSRTELGGTSDSDSGTPQIDAEDGEESGYEIWHYDALGVSLHFEEDADFRLSQIDVDALETSIHAVRPIGLEVAEARKLFAGSPGFELDAEYERTGVAVYELPGTSVSLWFQDGVCDSVGVAVPLAEDGEYVWPAI